MRRLVNGILLLDKSIDISSNGILQRVKRLFNAKKAGHTGSLDPLATGMLPICFGEATKFSQFLLDSDKTYHVVAKLGEQTTTGDVEGEVIATASTATITVEQIQAAIAKFVGTIDQVPPMFSALKYQGKPLYELARRGIEVERKARTITIFSSRFESYDDNLLTFTVHCSKGTYVRTLVEDIGHELGCGAHVVGLRRTAVTPYGNGTMRTLAELEEIYLHAGHAGLDACLLPIESAVNVFPAVQLSSAAEFYLRTGQSVRAPFPIDSQLVRLMAGETRFLGIGEVLPDGRVKPHRMLSMQDFVAKREPYAMSENLDI